MFNGVPRDLKLLDRAEGVLRTDNIRISGIGIEETMPSMRVRRPLGTNDNLMIHFHDPAFVTIQGQDVAIEHPSIVIWRTGQPQIYGSDMSGWAHTWIHCSGHAIDSLMDDVLPAPLTVHRTQVEPRFVEALYALYLEASASRPNPRVVEHLTVAALRQAAGCIKEESEQRIPARLRRAEAYINLHFTLPMSVASLSEIAGMSASHFAAQFRHFYKKPPMRYVTQLRIQYAKQLMESGVPISEASWRSGYSDAAYFSRLFKQVEGVNPTKWRRDDPQACSQGE